MPADTEAEENLSCNHPGHLQPRGILAGCMNGLIVSIFKREYICIAVHPAQPVRGSAPLMSNQSAAGTNA